ncbi:MAG: VanW family protein [Syntrophomonas sp.]
MRKIIVLIFISGLLITSISCSSIRTGRKYLNSNDNKTQQTIPANNEDKISSGPVTDVPWSEDETFKAAQLKMNAPIQMAAYRTVLRDPLPGEENNVHLAARILAGKIVEPGRVFSMNNSIGPYSSARGFQKGPVYIGGQLSTTTGGGVCKMASTLYNVAVLSDLPIVERHSHGMPVPYVPYGQDATVSTGVADIKFKNDLSYPILIWAQGVDNTLYVAFYGLKSAPQIEWHHEILQQFKTYTIYRNNPSLPKGTEKTVVEGMDGAQVKSWITITNGDGSTKTKELGMSSYRPLPIVVERN